MRSCEYGTEECMVGLFQEWKASEEEAIKTLGDASTVARRVENHPLADHIEQKAIALRRSLIEVEEGERAPTHCMVCQYKTD